MARIVFTKGLVFDGTGSPPEPGEVVVDGDRVVETHRGWRDDHGDDRIIDATACTVMPGLIESHSHLTFPSAIGHSEPGFNPPVDVSFLKQPRPLEGEVTRTERNAAILLNSGFTSAYSAGSILPLPTEVIVRDKIAAGTIRGPRLLAASMERENHPIHPDGRASSEWEGPDDSRAWVREQAAAGFNREKFQLSGVDGFFEGGSQITEFTQEEASAAGEEARERGVWLNAHAQAAESVKIAVRAGFRSIYHCTYADEEALDLLESVKDEVFVSPAPGIMYANVYEGEEFGIDRAMAEKIGSVTALDAMAELYPRIRRRGIRVLPGGDYGFPNNPIGRNARDLQLFVEVLGYTELETLRAATQYGGQLMGMGDELGLLAPGYLADVLVVRGNPAEDVRVLQDADKLVAIMQGGRFHKEPVAVGSEG